jgi:hypothetical protein
MELMIQWQINKKWPQKALLHGKVHAASRLWNRDLPGIHQRFMIARPLALIHKIMTPSNF